MELRAIILFLVLLAQAILIKSQVLCEVFSPGKELCSAYSSYATVCVEKHQCRDGVIDHGGFGEIVTRRSRVPIPPPVANVTRDLCCEGDQICCWNVRDAPTDENTVTTEQPIVTPRETNLANRDCERFATEGFRCVPRDQCSRTGIVKLDRHMSLAEFNQYHRMTSGLAVDHTTFTCQTPSLKCCWDPSPLPAVFRPPGPVRPSGPTPPLTRTTSSGRPVRCSSHVDFACVPQHLCRNGVIITNGRGVLAPRQGDVLEIDPTQSMCEESFLEVCCRRNSTHTKSEDVGLAPAFPDYKPQCGQRNLNGVGVRLTNLNDPKFNGSTQWGEWPNMCILLISKRLGANDDSVNLFECGASLIAPGVALTAAHCIQPETPANFYTIRCGEWDAHREVESPGPKDIRARRIISHPEFDKDVLYNDIAVLFLEEEFDLSPYIDTICLPKPDETFNTEECFATGWGKDRFGSAGTFQTELRQVKLDMVPNSQCQVQLRKTALGKYFILDESFLCAGGIQGEDTCQGDGGGPLMCPRDNTYVQVGIVSWGIGCGEADVPGVYANVQRSLCFLNWAANCEENSGMVESLGVEKDCVTWASDRLAHANRMVESAVTDFDRIRWEKALEEYATCQR